MRRGLLIIFFAALIIMPLAFFGCKGRVEKATESETSTAPTATTIEEMQSAPVTEPAQTVATETIPPTAAPEITPKPVAMPPASTDRNKDIQKALKAAGFYAGTIDGKIGPRTKVAIEAFQKAKGLKVDGKVGPKTWSELEKYLTQ